MNVSLVLFNTVNELEKLEQDLSTSRNQLVITNTSPPLLNTSLIVLQQNMNKNIANLHI